MIPVFSHFQQVSLPWGWGEDQMPLKRPDGRWGIIKINVINELPFIVSAGGMRQSSWVLSRRRRGTFFFTVLDAS